MAEQVAAGDRASGLRSRLARLWRERGHALLAVAALSVIVVCSNVLVHRFYKRWDWTSDGLYTLSEATLQTLHSLSEPVEVIVFLSASDPLTLTVRHMLEAYGAETQRVRARFVDPDQNPAEFLALQNEYGIVTGKTEDGRVVADASIVIVRGARRWFVTTDDIVVYDENDGRAKPRLEQALTEGLRHVLTREATRICFTTGHEELSTDDGGPRGLAELYQRIRKDNYDPRTVNLAPGGERGSLLGCRVVAVIGAELPFAASASKRLLEYLRGGGNLLVMVNPVLEESNRIRSSGLEGVLRAAGIELGNDFVVERAAERVLPNGVGESFFAAPKLHAITSAMLKDDAPRFLPMLTAAQSLRPTKDGHAEALLVTSEQAFSVRDIRPFVEDGERVEPGAGDAHGPFSIAMASELPVRAGSKERHGSRVVVVGSANVAFGQSWRDPVLLPNRLLIESALAWLAAQPAIVSVPEKPGHAAGLSLTEDALREVLIYVLLLMPVTSVVLGASLLWRRRAREKASRGRAAGAGT